MTPAPPRFAERLLARALRDDPAGPAILGDVHEDFARVVRERGPSAARRWYVREAVPLALGRLGRRLLHPFAGPSAMRDSHPLRGLAQDAVYAVRAVRRDPAFAVFTAGVVALGVGAATAVFSVTRAFGLGSLPFEDPAALVWITPGFEGTSLSDVTSRSGNLRDFRERSRAFEGLTGYNAFFDQTAYTLQGAGEPQRLVGVGVAHDFLEVLGVEPLLGRGFTAEEGAWDGPRAVILTHGLWVRRFGADPGVVGGAVTLDGGPYTVAGVLPATFDFTSIFTPGVPVDLLLPFPVSPETDRWGNTMALVGRLRPGVGPEAAEADLQAVVAGLREEQPDRWGLGAEVEPLHEHLAGPFRPALRLLAGAAAALLLIVVVNVSNLVLSRAPGRAREVAVRRAFGASRGRLVRQLVLETVGVALIGAALGGLLAWAASRGLARSAAVRVPFLDRVEVDGWALLFSVGVAVLTGLLVGLVPAVQVAEGGEGAALRASGRGSGPSRGARRVREGLVVAEVALACVLLVVGGLLVRSFGAVLDVDLGFDPSRAVAWQLNPGRDFENQADMAAFYAALTDRVGRVPGVEAVGLVDALPLGKNRTWGLALPGAAEDDPGVEFFPHLADPGYLETMRIPVVAGRGITRDDTGDARDVLLVNESAARRIFGDADPVGRTVMMGRGPWEVVGVVRDVRHLSPEMDGGAEVYFPIAQMWDFSTLEMVVRSRLSTAETATAVSAALRELDPAMPTGEFWTVASTVERSVSARRFTLEILSSYGAAALFLAALGIYGVLSHSVAERRAEIGIRMALGASAAEVMRSVLLRTLGLAAVGVAGGAALALVGSRLVGSLLFGVGAADPVAFLGTAGVLLLVAAVAGAVPAVRAARTRGIRALQAD